MSTNAAIVVEGKKGIAVYKHWDGYPEATLQWLQDFNKDFAENYFAENWGDDPDYKFAQLLRSSERDGDYYNLDRSKYTGWGVVDWVKGDSIEYLYELKTNGDVYVNGNLPDSEEEEEEVNLEWNQVADGVFPDTSRPVFGLVEDVTNKTEPKILVLEVTASDTFRFVNGIDLKPNFKVTAWREID